MTSRTQPLAPSKGNPRPRAVLTGQAPLAQLCYAVWEHIDPTGRVGLGRIAKTNTLEVNGEASKTTAGSWLSNSDARIKENVETIDPEVALSKVLSLRPVSYSYTEGYREKYPEVGRRRRWVNFIAQEYAEVFPEAVTRTEERLWGDEGVEAAEGILQVDVHDVNIHLVAALQAQQRQIAALRSELDGLLHKVST